MRKPLLIAGAIIASLLLIIVIIFAYAAVKLNSIVASNRAALLARASAALGREVSVTRIHVSLGWGVALRLDDLRVADDPTFGQLPFLTAKQVLCRVALLPLLTRRIKVSRFVLLSPDIRVLRNQAGILNISTLGKRQAEQAPRPATPVPQPAQPAAPVTSPMQSAPPGTGGGRPLPISVSSLTVSDGNLLYQDASDKTAIRIAHTDVEVDNLSASTPFAVNIHLAALGQQQNVALRGTIGPVMREGKIDLPAIPLALTLTLGPIALAQLRGVPALQQAIPPRLAISQPISATIVAKGSPARLDFRALSDLSAPRVIYQGVFDKPAGKLLRFTANGALAQRVVTLSEATLDLAGLQARISDVSIVGHAWRAKLETNRFDLAPLAPMALALARYQVGGSAQAHVAVASGSPSPTADGTLTLSDVGLMMKGGKLPAVSGLSATLTMHGNSATLPQARFKLGSANVELQAQAQSLNPLQASYTLQADQIKPAQLMATRPADEYIDKLSVQGSARSSAGALAIDAALRTASGMVARVPYRDLAVQAAYGGNAVKISSLTMQAYGGSLQAAAQAALAGARPFQISAQLSNINIEQALAAQQAKAAGVLKGLLSGQAQLSGRGSDWAQIEPTLAGNGRMQVRNGKLVGVNVVASTLNKIGGLPGIDTVLTPTIVARHPELFRNPDTDLTDARLSFTMAGPRLTSHDITVATADYRMLGDGWFDLDKHLDLNVSLLLSRELSSELRNQKKNVVYLMNSDGEIQIPLRISGQLPKPSVQPDVQDLARRAAAQAIERHGSELLKKFLGGSAQGSGSNPLGTLQRLLP